MTAYHKDITEYFVLPQGAYGQQITIHGSYQTLMYALNAIPSGPEKSVAMRKLLESFDAAMRAAT